MPREYNFYFEPFLGAGAVLFELQPERAIVNDTNSDLVNCYEVIKQFPEQLITHARSHPITEEYFYSLRSLDRDPDFHSLSALERASRIIFLNKTCFNGLFRVNSQGQFNVPFNRNPNPHIVDEVAIRAISRYLNRAEIEMLNTDFGNAVSRAGRDDFAYLDPPYDPRSDTSSFTGYNLRGFDRDEQRRLKAVCDDLTSRGCKILLSNSATAFIRDLYSDTRTYTIVEVEANRNINAQGRGRGKIKELLIYNNYAVDRIED